MYEAHFVPRGQPGCHARLPRRRSIPGWRRTSCSAERLGPGRLEADEGGRLRRTRNQDQGRIGSVPHHLPGGAGGSDPRAPCVSEENAADGAAGYRTGRKTAQGLEGTTMNVETFDSVFDALADTQAEAANMTARADLLLAIRERIKKWNLTQEDAGARLGLTRPRLNDLMRGKLDKFSLDALVNIAAAAGFRLHIELEDVKAA